MKNYHRINIFFMITLLLVSCNSSTLHLVGDPIISRITNNSASITWITSNNSNAQVEYGESNSYGMSSALEKNYNTVLHTHTLTGLKANTTYHYRINSSNANGAKIISNDYVLRTLALATLPTATTTSMPPERTFEITRPPLVSNINDTSVNIEWGLSENATGQIEYGATINYGSFSIKENSFKYSSHIQELSNLNTSTTYHFRIHSINQNGLESISTDQTFKTLASIPSHQLPTFPGSCLTATTSNIEVNVKSFGAKGDGVTNDTASIQNAVNAVAGTGGTVIVPDGSYLVRPIFLKNNMNFKMASKTILQAIGFKKGDTTNIYTSNILIIEEKSNINISGGTLIGERNNHDGKVGEFGHGIMITFGYNIAVENVVSRDNWGDGFFVYLDNKNIRLCSVIADNNRRQGLSVVMADGVLIKGSTFINTNGTPPAAGIDLEPDAPDRLIPFYSVKNVTISNCILKDNQGDGLLIAANNGPVSDVTMTGTVISGNRGGSFWAGNASSGYSKEQLNKLNIHVQY